MDIKYDIELYNIQEHLPSKYTLYKPDLYYEKYLSPSQREGTFNCILYTDSIHIDQDMNRLYNLLMEKDICLIVIDNNKYSYQQVINNLYKIGFKYCTRILLKCRYNIILYSEYLQNPTLTIIKCIK